MEGFFDNFLYIIITIAVLAFSMLNKKKKTEEARRETSKKPGSIFDTFEEIFSEVPGEEAYIDEEEEILETATPAGSVFDKPRLSNKPTNEEFNPEVVSVFSKLAEKKAPPKTKSQIEEEGMIIDMKYDWDSDEEKSAEIDFDLRSAVIQSEILNRKYS
jgi:hypothetical protein